jgi:hypothetical protein
MRTGWRPYSMVAAIFGLMLSTACTGSTSQRPLPAFAEDGGRINTVETTRRDVTSVVTLDAVVIASPGFTVAAQRAGVVTRTGRTTGTIARIRWDDGSVDIALPGNATLHRHLVADGARVPAGLPVAEATYTGFALAATIPATTLYRFYGTLGPVRAQIDHGPGPFDCPLLGVPAPGVTGGTGTGSTPTGGEDTGVAGPGDTAADSRLVCAPPADLRLMVGSRAIIAVTTGSASEALTLPVEAVAGLVNHGTVLVDLGDGRTESREVGLGITDGTVVEITSGLTDGDRVVIPAPNLVSR